MTNAELLIRNENLERELVWAHLKIQVLEERLRKQRIGLLGPRSETLSNLQLQLLVEEEPSVTVAEVEAEAGREPIAPKPVGERKAHPGRVRLPENLPRVEQTLVCKDVNCGACGEQTTVIGYDESELLDVEPARYFVRVTKREKRACRHCAQSKVTSAPIPARIIEKGSASDRIVVQTIVGKYCDHLPLYRQEAILEREAGVEISRATLDGWVMRVGELLGPVVEAMRKDLLTASYLQADETTVPVQMGDKRGANHEAYLLPQSSLGKAAAYTINQWTKLKRCLEYEQVELSNNLAENSMRPVALGRKNWLHVGSPKSGPKVAAILSVVESCRRLRLPVKDYLLAVLPGLDRRTLGQVRELTPARWAAARA